jgi:hypothetical protein
LPRQGTADNAHEVSSIYRQNPDGCRGPITISGPAGRSDDIVATLGKRMLLWSGLGIGGPSSLFWYNPVIHRTQFLARNVVNDILTYQK